MSYKNILFILCCFLALNFSFSQNFELLDLIDNNQTSIESCDGSLSFTNDNDTLENQNFEFTICPEDNNDETLSILSNFDITWPQGIGSNPNFFIEFYDGIGTDGELLGSSTLNADNLDTITPEDESATGCVTVKISTGSYIIPGFPTPEFSINFDFGCRPPCQELNPVINIINGTTFEPTESYEIPVNGQVNFTASVNPSSGSTEDLTYEWFTIPETGVTNPSGDNLTFSTQLQENLNYTICFSVTDEFGCTEVASCANIETFIPGADCQSSQLFCSPAAPYVFPNNTGVPSAGNQSCLATTPNPTWYYLTIEEAGDLEFEIIQSTGGFDGDGNPIGTLLDVDFVAWGPFDEWETDNCDNLDNCSGIAGCNNNTNPNSQYPFPGGTNVVDCSYDAAAIETLTIPNAEIGEVYAVLITNFNGSPGFISLQQTNVGDNNSGLTDCGSIFEYEICEGESVFLELPNPVIADIEWFELDENDDFQPIEVGNPLVFEVTESGTYLAETFDINGNPTGEFEYFVTVHNRQFPASIDDIVEVCVNDEFEDYTHDLTIYDFDFFDIENTEDLEIIYKDENDVEITDPLLYEPEAGTNTINIEINNTETEECSTFTSIDLNFTFLNFDEPEDLLGCQFNSSFDLTVNIENVLTDSMEEEDYTFIFIDGNEVEIENPENYSPENLANETILVQIIPVSNEECVFETEFDLLFYAGIDFENLEDLTNCGDFTYTQNFNLISNTNNIYQLNNEDDIENISYFLTEQDAINGENAIDNLVNYSLPVGVNQQTIYVRVRKTSEFGSCLSFSSFELLLYNVEIATNPLPTLVECESNFENGQVFFDLTQQNEFVLGPNQQIQDYSISYFEDLADANGGSNPIAEPSQYTGNEEAIFVRIQHNENPECFEVGQFDLIRIENIDFTGIEDLNQCGDFSYNQGFNLISNTLNIFDFNDEEDIENISYFVTEQDAINNENAIDNLVQYSLPNGIDQQTIFVRVQLIGEEEECINLSSFELRLFNVEIANPLPDLVECITDGSETFTFDLTQQNGLILGGNQETVDYSIAYFTSEADANNGVNPIQNPEAYEAEEETIWVRIDNLNALDFDEECFEIDQFEIEAVQPATVNLDLDPLEECDTNNDNFSSEFDLDALIPIINFLDLDVEISFHLTEEDAASGNSPLASPFQNITDDTQTIWVRVEDAESGCTQFTSVQLITYDTPQTQEVSVLEACAISDTNFAQVFDITEAEEQLLMNVTDSDNINIDYYINEDSAINETAANLINNPDSYLSQTNQDNLEQTVYVRVTNSESPIDCFSLEAITLRVNPLPDFTPPTLLAVCKDDTSGIEGQFASFDLTSKIPEITNNNANLEVSFYLNEDEFEAGNTIENPEDYTNTVNPQSVFVAIESAQTACSTTTNLTLVVSPNPTIPEPEPLVECDPGDNGFAQFDLAAAIEDILANEVEAEISFHETEQQAINNTNPIPIFDDAGNSVLFENENPFAQTLFVRASTTGNSNQLDTNCFVVRPLELIVEPSPSVIDLEDLVSCDDASPNGFTAFDLTVNEVLILGEQNPSEVEITYHLTAADAEAGVQQIAVPQNFTNFTNPQEIFVRIESVEGRCSPLENNSFTISVEPRPSIELTASYEYVCADPSDAQEQDNEIATFDLTQKNEEINPDFGDPTTEVRYYASEEDYLTGNFINDPTSFQNTENPQLLIADVVDLTNGCASFTFVEFEFHVHPLPLAAIGNMDGATICVDPLTGELTDPDNLPILDTDLDDVDYEFVWYLDGEELNDETSSSLIAFIPGLYEVEVTDTAYSLKTDCFKTSQAEIIESSAPLFEVNVLSSPFDGDHTIEIVNIQGSGNYEFSVDGGAWIPQNNQEQIIVSGLEIGEISVIGRDRNGCGEEIKDVSLIDYPKFFTPNNDGFNDSWNVVGLENQPEANIYIFDRYGKLLKQIKPFGDGWDGTYNGKPMPSNDYWFKVEYISPRTGAKKTFKSNFTLKR